MAAVTDYTTLAAAIDEWAERGDWDTDQLIALAEAEFRLHLDPHFSRETSTTLAFVSGSATLPTGFVRPLALTHATYGPLQEASIGYVRERRVMLTTGIPDCFAITGSTVEVAPTYTGDLTFDFESTLTALSSTNATNWLITAAPQAYLAMCMFFGKAKDEDPMAGSYRAQALSTVDALVQQSTVAQYGRASTKLRGATP
jgi:hypothetical protein